MNVEPRSVDNQLPQSLNLEQGIMVTMTILYMPFARLINDLERRTWRYGFPQLLVWITVDASDIWRQSKIK